MSIKIAFLVLAVIFISESTAVFWDDLRIHFDFDLTRAFYRQGRNSSQAEIDGWKLISSDCRNGGQFAGFRYVERHPSDDGVVLIYDRNGIVSGIQQRLPHELILTPENKFRFDLVPFFQNVTETGRTYFILTAYFVDPKIICTTGRNETDLELEGTGTGLWFQNGPTPDHVIQAPKDRPTAIIEGWSKNQCIPAMGFHNFFGVESYTATNCTQQQPTFLLFNTNEEMVGFGFTTQGSASSRYFEYPSNLAISAILGPPVPQCVLDGNDLIGTTTIHVYFVDNPWLLACQ